MAASCSLARSFSGDEHSRRAPEKTLSDQEISVHSQRGEDRERPTRCGKGHFVEVVRREIQLGLAEMKEKVEGLENSRHKKEDEREEEEELSVGKGIPW